MPKGIDEGNTVEKIAQALGKRLKGSGDSSDMYTSIGTNVLVALNPYMSLSKAKVGLYDDPVALHYWTASPHLSSPHVFKTATSALQRLVAFHRDQTVIITGESGAGKTETAKHMVTFLAHIAGLSDPQSRHSAKGRHAASVTKGLLDSNPVLEAFGNAATNHNGNSSRFGKLLELKFAGAHVASGLVHTCV